MKVSNKKKLNKEIFNYLSGYKSKKTIVKSKFLSKFLKLIKNEKLTQLEELNKIKIYGESINEQTRRKH